MKDHQPDLSPAIIDADSTMARAYLLMSRYHCHTLPVSSDGHFVGVISSRDVEELLDIYTPGKMHENPLKVAHYMRGPVKVVDARSSLSEIIKSMVSERLYAVLVLFEGRLGGILSKENLLEALAKISLEKKNTAADILRILTNKPKLTLSSSS